jgi:hypothetical protein
MAGKYQLGEQYSWISCGFHLSVTFILLQNNLFWVKLKLNYREPNTANIPLEPYQSMYIYLSSTSKHPLHYSSNMHR